MYTITGSFVPFAGAQTFRKRQSSVPCSAEPLFQPKRCWAYTPIVVLTSRLSLGAPVTVAPDTVSTPGAGNTFPARKLFLSCLRVNCPPTDEADERVDVSWKVAVPE